MSFQVTLNMSGKATRFFRKRQIKTVFTNIVAEHAESRVSKGTVKRATLFFFSSACLATLLHCKLKPSVARITTFVTNCLSRNKIQHCKLRQQVAQSRLEFYFLQQILDLVLVLLLRLQVKGVRRIVTKIQLFAYLSETKLSFILRERRWHGKLRGK